MNNQLKVCAGLFLACTAMHAQEEEKVQVLDEVVVSDSRFTLKREQSGKTVIYIGPEELARNQGKTAAELINSKSGMEISGSRGRQGEVLGVFARGGRGRQVLVLIDGLRVSDPSSFSQEYDLRMLALDGIESIEIIKGASSTLYGTNAAAAVISITTKKRAGTPFRLSVGSTVGTNSTAEEVSYSPAAFNNYVRLDGTAGRLEYSTGISQTYEDNLSSLRTAGNEEDPFSRYRLDMRLGYSLGDKTKVSLYGNHSRFKSDYDESFGPTDAAYQFISEQKRAGVALESALGSSEIHLNAAFSEFSSENFSAFPGTFEGSNQVVDVYYKMSFCKKFYTLLGINYIKDRATQVEVRDFTLVDPYLNVVYLSGFGLNINTGTRINIHSEYGNQWVYNLNPSFNLGVGQGNLKLMATLATSYITPSLSQLFGEFGANPDLEPETDHTLEAGLEWTQSKQFRASLLYFNRREEQYVFFDSADFLYRNASGTIKAQGVEAEARWRLVEGVRMEANYTFTERRGDNAIRIPRHKINAELGLDLSEKLYGALQYSYTGTRTDTDFNTFTDRELEPFSLFGVYLSQEILPDKMKVFISAENLLNTTYTEILGFTTRGRNLRLGVNLVL